MISDDKVDSNNLSSANKHDREKEDLSVDRTRNPPTSLLFQYIGSSSLLIKGLLSGKNYDFASPGTILEIDPRDRSILRALPKIKQLEG